MPVSPPEQLAPDRPASGAAVPGGRNAAGVAWRDHRMLAAVVAAAIAWVLFLYRDTLAPMIDIWRRSDTFAHGYLIAPISLWLVWRMRDRLAAITPAPSLLGVFGCAATGFAWMLGELVSVASVSQFALVGLVVSLVWAIVGTPMARALAFPLGFLFFAVPFGEFLFPSMMEWTKDFIVVGLRLSGVPVYAEGLNLVVPTGRWQVVEGCSGIRYLIASVVVGSLYAYLTYRSALRRVLFVALAIVTPVLANWIRAYGIVMIGHLSGNKLATGLDHLVYGWVFFGIVMMLLFWMGARWREDEAPARAEASVGASGAPSLGAASIALFGAALIIASAWPSAHGVLTAQGRQGPVTIDSLPAAAGWSRLPTLEGLDWKPHYNGMRGELHEAWSSETGRVGVYVAYYRAQSDGAELISSNNRVVAYKDEVWTQGATGSHRIAIGTAPVAVETAQVYDQRQRFLVWHWYWVSGDWTANVYRAKLHQALSVLMGQGDAAAAVMLYAPVDERNRAAQLLERFVREMGPGLAARLEAIDGG